MSVKLALVVLIGSCIALSMLSTWLFSRPNNPLTYYDVLGLENVQPTQLELKRHYRKLIRQLHPDLASSDEQQDFAFSLDRVNRAYNVLSSPLKRIQYDFSLAHAGTFYSDIVQACQFDSIPRVYEFEEHLWPQRLGNELQSVLSGYEQKFPQWSHFAREIYSPSSSSSSSSTEGNDDVPDIFPYVLQQIKGYDNTVSYHFSDWREQLDRPRQILITTLTVLGSLGSMAIPFFVGCCGGGSDEQSDADLIDEGTSGSNLTEAEINARLLTAIAQNSKHAKQNRDEETNRLIKEQARIRAINQQRKTILAAQSAVAAAKNAKNNTSTLSKKDKKPSHNNHDDLTTPQDDNNENDNCDSSQDDVQDGQDEPTQKFECTVCRNTYHTENQYSQHMKSKQHQKRVKSIATSKKAN